MFLIFRLGRPDVLPVDDYGIRKGFAPPTASATSPARRSSPGAGSAGRRIARSPAGTCGVRKGARGATVNRR